MALKVNGEDPKSLVYDPGGLVSRGERIGGGFCPLWGSRVVVLHLRWRDPLVVLQCSRHRLTVVEWRLDSTPHVTESLIKLIKLQLSSNA
jgi:hypothetical protein